MRRSVIITFIENVLECLGVSDLTEVLAVISAHICQFASSLEEADQNKLLRIINHLLKRISKTEDYHLRGQLHLTLTRFLPLCHDSGFHYRSLPARPNDWEKAKLADDAETDSMAPEVTYEFYEQFWELQRYFMEVGELGRESGKEGAGLRLRKVEATLREVEAYFNLHPAKQTSDYYSHPLKFLKNFNLLALQLSDPFFRKVIMLQTLIFAFTLLNQSAKPALVLADPDKKLVADIEAIAANYLRSKCGPEGRELLEETARLLGNELYWVELKDNWKDKKKTYVRKMEGVAEEEAKHKVGDIERKRAEIKKQINERIKIEGENLAQFLQNREPISLQKAPTSTSFSAFYTESLALLRSFDLEAARQTEFETRSEYNMFEWKAMRSLYRENVKEIWSSSDSKTKDYRLINLLSRKEEELADPEPSKKTKLE